MTKVAIQGIKGSFHEEAAVRYFEKEKITIVECASFKKMCKIIDADKVDYAVMAIENSIAGSLLNNYQLISEYHLRVVGELYVHIQMNLIAQKDTKPSDIQCIYSHPVAIQQCTEYIENNFPHIELIDKMDTAGSAKYVAESNEKGIAAIANTRSAELYSLNILERGIEDNKMNYTRFFILSKYGNPSSITNKASISFQVGHFHGALAAVLSILAENHINLSKIQSIPIFGKPNEYSFHADIEWQNQEEYNRAIHQVLKRVSSLSILGEYKQAERTITNQTI